LINNILSLSYAIQASLKGANLQIPEQLKGVEQIYPYTVIYY